MGYFGAHPRGGCNGISGVLKLTNIPCFYIQGVPTKTHIVIDTDFKTLFVRL